ncbi:MAG: S9 family peptidase [SAR202 cluster bacterium]|nr:S9 family peptidase [SAR202 cluster bacterium]
MSRPIGPDFMFHVKSVADPSITGQGDRVAFTVGWVDHESAEPRSRIAVVRLRGGSPVDFTRGEADDMPRWSPDGGFLGFRRRAQDGKRHLWIMPCDGGEPWQVTCLNGGVSEFSWAPDSMRLAVVSDVDPADSNDARFPRTTVVTRIRYHEDGIGLRGDARRHIFTVDRSGTDVTRRTEGDFDNNTPVWSPDGGRIAFISARSEDRDIAAGSEAYVLDVPGAGSGRSNARPSAGATRKGTPKLWSKGLFNVGGLGWSPDGKRLVVVGSDSADRSGGYSLYSQGWLYVLEPGKKPRQVSDDSVRPVVSTAVGVPNQDLIWKAGGQILFLADHRGASYVCAVPERGGPVKRIAGGGMQIGRWSCDRTGENAVVSAVPPDSIGDIVAMSLKSGKTKRLSSYNDDYFGEHPPARLERFEIVRGGLSLECRLWLPPDFDPGKKYPLLLEIHGGPQGVFYDAFIPQHQIPATAGYVVLAVNPRGSSSYGLSFTTAVHGDWGGEDYLDLMAAVDEVQGRPYIDSDRMVVAGYSYGGFMSSWIVGHTNRFKAAVVGAPVTNLESFSGTSDIGISFGEVQFGASRFGGAEWYRAHSPINYAPEVTTPVLLMHGESDRRCPIEQSEQYFVALKRLGKVVEFVRFPGGSHGLLRLGHPKLRQEYFERMMAWFDRYAGSGAR